MGNVAATAHQNGSAKSAISPSPANVSQNIFRCMSKAYRENCRVPAARAEPSLVRAQFVRHKTKKAGSDFDRAPLRLNNYRNLSDFQ